MYCSRCGTKNADEAKFCQNCGAPLTSTVSPATPVTPPAVQYAGFWRRFVAYSIDGMILSVPNGILVAIFGLQLLVSTKLPDPSVVYLTTTPDKLGRIPVRKELEVKIFDNAPKTSFNIVGWQILGFGIHNSFGVVRIAAA